MALLPAYVADQRRRKPTRRGSKCSSKAVLLFACACVFLGYVGLRRSSRGGLPPVLGGSGSFFYRRDLKEKIVTLEQVALHANGTARWGSWGDASLHTFPATPTSCRVLLATHSRLMWYSYDTGDLNIIHEGQGIYYGGFPGDEIDSEGAPTTLWVVSRPHNWRPTSAKEWLLQLDATTGKELQRIPLASHFTHDTVRAGNHVYVANTGDGAVLELEFPSMKELRRMDLFTEKEHVNTLSPTGDGRMWAMLHNLGPSVLAEVDLASGKVVRRITQVGMKSHGAVQWNNFIISLDSDNAALIKVDPRRPKSPPLRLWAASERRRYLKGLCVVDDIAFFGIAESQARQSRDSTDLNCELGAFDLLKGVLLWRRQLPTRGLLNVVAAPHLQVESTAHAVRISDQKYGYRSTHEYVSALEAAKANAWQAAGDPMDEEERVEQRGGGGGAGLGGKKLTLMDLEPLPATDPLSSYPPTLDQVQWASGYPRLDLKSKDMQHGLASGVQLLLFHHDVTALRDYVLGMGDGAWQDEEQRRSNAFLGGRSGNLNEFKPGTTSIHLIFSDQGGNDVYEFPWYRQRFQAMVEPLLEKLLGDDAKNVIRCQLARMPAGTHIKRHVDRGGYSAEGHRIHVVVASSPAVAFHVCEGDICLPLHVEEGLVFELNNRLQHYVDNDGSAERVHMVIDVAEQPRTRTLLAPGQECLYVNGKIKC